MSSKLLTHEYKENLPDGTTLSYGSMNEKSCDIISINVRGRLKATEKKNDFNTQAKQLKENTIKQVANVFETCEWINSHYIFTCDFTEKGILYNKPFRFKYQAYVKPTTREPIVTYKDGIFGIVGKINGIIADECRKVSFMMAK